jgi:sensor domain CHASE-containing protein
MDLALLIYGISLLEGLKVLFGMIIVTSIMALIFSGIFTCNWKFDGSEYSWNLNKDGTVKERILAGRRFVTNIFKYSLVATIIAGFANILLPSERTAYMMVGAYATQKVAENEKVQETGKKVLTLIEQKLDSYIESSMKDVEKSKKGKKHE